MFRFCVQILCSDFVFRFCVQILCSDFVFRFCVGKCAGTPKYITTATNYASIIYEDLIQTAPCSPRVGRMFSLYVLRFLESVHILLSI